MVIYRSHTVTHGRNMAGARALFRAAGVDGADLGRKPIIAVANSFTEFVPGERNDPRPQTGSAARCKPPASPQNSEINGDQ